MNYKIKAMRDIQILMQKSEKKLTVRDEDFFLFKDFKFE